MRYDVCSMKKQKLSLNEQLSRIRSLNESIQNNDFNYDNEDLLYEPEYYERAFHKDDPSDDEIEDPEDIEKLKSMQDFSQDMSVSPKGFYELPLKKPEKSEEKDEGFYSQEQANEFFDKLTAGELAAEEIDQRALTALLTTGVIVFLPDEYEHKFYRDRRQLLRGQVNFDLGFFKFAKYQSTIDIAAKTITEDREKFRSFINNAIAQYPNREGKRRKFNW